jgi:hypothetical protein
MTFGNHESKRIPVLISPCYDITRLVVAHGGRGFYMRSPALVFESATNYFESLLTLTLWYFDFKLPMLSNWKRGEVKEFARRILCSSLQFICVILFAEYSEEDKTSFSVFNSHPPTPGFSLLGTANILPPN